EVAGAQQEVQEVEAARALLESVVALHHRPELVAELRGEVGSGPPHEIIQRRAEPRPPLEQLGLREAGRGAPEARPPPVLVAAEAEQLRFEAVVVAPEDRLAPADLLAEARDLGERPDEVVVGGPGRGGGAEAGHLLHERVDPALALEALLVAPCGGAIAPRDELPPRGP